MANRLVTFSRSAAVGVVATAFDFVTLVVLVSGLGVSARVASFPALGLGIIAQFVGNKRFAFRNHSPDWLRQGLCFLAIEAFGLACNALCFDRLLVLTPLPYVVCRMLSTSLVYFCVCLPLWSRLFAQPPGESAPAAPLETSSS